MCRWRFSLRGLALDVMLLALRLQELISFIRTQIFRKLNPESLLEPCRRERVLVMQTGSIASSQHI